MDHSALGTRRRESSVGASVALRWSASMGGAAGWVLAVRVAAVGAAFCFAMAVARLFGASLAGVLALGITASVVARGFGQLGLATPMLRFVATEADSERWERVSGIYRRGLRMAVAAAVLVTMALAVAAPVLARRVFSEPELTAVLRGMSLGVVPGVVLVVHASLLRAVHRPVQAAALDSLGPPLVALLVLGAVTDSRGITGAALALVIGTTVMMVASVAAWFRAVDRSMRPAPFSSRPLLRAGLPVLILTATFLVIEWSDTIMLGALEPSATVGIYAAAARVAVLIALVLQAVNAVTAPHYAALYAKGDGGGMRRLAVSTTALMIAVALPMTIVIIVGAEPILGLFGSEFRAGATVLVILAGAQFVHVASGSVGNLLMMTGRERILRDIVVGAAGANILLNALLIPLWGPEGAAVASAISLVGLNVVTVVAVRRTLGFYTLPGLGRWSDA
jgi:O-antigen/teichoic acid export membrane protein